MILLDANLLIYAFTDKLPQHVAAKPWFEQVLNGSSRVGLPWVSILAFLRVATDLRLFQRPPTMTQAWQRVEEWLAIDRVWIPQPTPQHPSLLKRLLVEAGGKPQLVTDAHLATLAIEHGLTLCSTDGDFARFKELRWLNPLR